MLGHSGTPGVEPVAREAIAYTIPVIGALACFYALANFDLIMIKHYFNPEEAGIYSGVAVLGRALLFLPAAVVLVLFPMVSASHTQNKDTFGILVKGLLLTGMLTGVGALLYVLVPDFLLSTLLGEKFAVASPLLRLYGFVMLPLALVNVLINFYLARSETRFVYILIVALCLQLGLISIYHGSLFQIIYIMIIVSYLVMIAIVAMLLAERRQWVATEAGKVT
jgi:O-antigen/teichoic acid export membrane protein